MGQHLNVPKCTALIPDCFNCPFSDCIASNQTIMRQIAHKERLDILARDSEIYDLRVKEGLSSDALAERYGLSRGGINHILVAEKKRRENKKNES